MQVTAKIEIKTPDKEVAKLTIEYLNELTSKVPAEKIISLCKKIRHSPEGMIDKAMPFL